MMRTNTQSPFFAALTAAFSIVLFAGCAQGGGAVRLEDKPNPFGGIPGPVISRDGKPVNAMVMPISVTLPPEVKLSDEDAAKLRAEVWKTFRKEVGDSAKFVLVPAPDGAEADEVIKQTMLQAAGIVKPDQFKKIKSFQLPERFLYGHVSVLVEEEETLKGLSVVKTTKYHVDAQVRLVESANFTYQPSLASARDADLKTAIGKAVKNALNRFRLSEDEKPAPGSGGDPMKGGGFFGRARVAPDIDAGVSET